MENPGKVYIAIDLKSFYASVECVERGLDPLKANLVVADESRTEKTICLAVSPSLKAYGIGGRARLFEVVQRVSEVNAARRRRCRGMLVGESTDDDELKADSSLALAYITAPPQMAHYMEVSTEIFKIYLRYIAPEDIHVYSIDEVFIDAGGYLRTYDTTPRELAAMMINEVREQTGITATAGIGPNMYLAKIAMDIVAKRMEADEFGVRIAELDVMSYRRKLWSHQPLSDFWRIGKGYERRLRERYIFTMGDIARCSLHNEDILYDALGVNAALLIDHAWGLDGCTMPMIKSYKPKSHSVSLGQVLMSPYSPELGKLIVREMADQVALDLVAKEEVSDRLELTVGYDRSGVPPDYDGEMSIDSYGRPLPKSAHGSIPLGRYTSSSRIFLKKIAELYDRIVDKRLRVRRMYLVAARVIPEREIPKNTVPEQLDMFTDYAALEKQREEEERMLARERSIQRAVIEIKKRYGKNAILRAMNFCEGATAIERNEQVGGHKA